MNSPLPHHIPHGWVDITPLFREATHGKQMQTHIVLHMTTTGEAQFKAFLSGSKMQLGELLMASGFELLDAMSALEIMDPKMDSGMASVADSAQSLRFDWATPLSSPQALWVMDTFMACEVTWHTGFSLVQTVLTCIYYPYISQMTFEGLTALADSQPHNFLLYVYLVITTKCIRLVSHEMRKGNVYEDEDFSTATYGQSFAEQILPHQVPALLAQATALVQSLAESHAADPHQCRIYRAMHNRFEVRAKLFDFFNLLASPTRATMPQCHQMATLIRILVASDIGVQQTYALGTAIPGAFSKQCACRYSGHMPPRPVDILGIPSATQWLLGMLSAMIRTTSPHHVGSPEGLTIFLQLLQYGTAPLAPFVRSWLISVIASWDSVLDCYSHRNVVIDSIHMFSCPEMHILPLARAKDYAARMNDFHPALMDKQYEASARFLAWVVEPYFGIYRSYCQNRPRQRRLLHKLVTEWETVHLEALSLERQDAQLAELTVRASVKGPIRENRAFSAWAYDIKLGLMVEFVLDAFGLDLYSPFEYVIGYWYADYLVNMRLNNAQSLLGQLQQRRDRLTDASEDAHRITESIGFLTYRTTYLALSRELCRGLVMLLAGLQRLDQHDACSYGLTTGDAYFNCRFRLFMMVQTPTYLPYSEWAQVDKHFSQTEPGVLLDTAHRHFEQSDGYARDALSLIANDANHDFSIDHGLQHHVLAMQETARINRSTVLWVRTKYDECPEVLAANRWVTWADGGHPMAPDYLRCRPITPPPP
ncbi:N-alpha-acetyltransferase, non-catalitic subunit [Dimargaris verticillata]|uniref:N-alpha-acetyltransferase, non-catalitic subunit n=1 Tax=Dimargaris verticillata TaxID=2761393 RepID=A0A9W8B9K2_9FUNG|nr:N-alpha-acetyltransferase, non-catalitic subunit [Dimargaris verticillata]